MKMFVLSLLVLVSCGRSENKSADAPEVPQIEEEENPNHSGRYTNVVMEENCGFWTDCDFTVRADLSQRPVILSANFVDNVEGQCEFQAALSEESSETLHKLADKLRVCEVKNSPKSDAGFDGLFISAASGKEYMVYKMRNGGQEEEGKINYLCGGRTEFYNFMSKLIVPEVPENCPSGYKRLFR